MSNDPMPLRSPADAAARRAFRAAAKLYDMADWHGIDPRTIARIAAGKRVVPPGLARDSAAMLHDLNGDNEAEIAALARALLAWADENEERAHG